MSSAVKEVPVAPEVEQQAAALSAKEKPSISFTESLRNRHDRPRKTPFVDPLPSAKPDPPQPLTADEQAKYDNVLATVQSWKEVPSAKGKEGPITEEETMWLTRECLLRYLRATKWNTAEAANRILGTLTWRREFGVLEHTAEHISKENETGKQIAFGFDGQGRPCLYLNPARQNTEPSHRQVEHLVYMLDRVIDLMPPGQESLTLLIDFKQSKSKSNTSPPMSIAREVLSILQTHYPERLGQACITNIPWVANMFLKVITPFIDPRTKAKLHFNEDVSRYVPREQLWTELGGDVEFEYDHSIYWPAFNGLCQEKYSERVARWEKAGKHIGESEIYLRGDDTPSVSQAIAGEAPQPSEEPEALEGPKVAAASEGPIVAAGPQAAPAPTAPEVGIAGIENQKPGKAV